MTAIAQPAEAGFTLIEALVALLILAIATVGLIRASEAHVDSIRALERRATAQWVAENRIAEAALPSLTPASTVAMLGSRWTLAVTARATDDPDLRAIHVDVSPAETPAAPMLGLDGFIDAGTTTP